MPKVEDFAMFDADADQPPDRTRYPGEAIHVLYDRRRCMHAAECGRGSRSVFDASRSPWIQPDNASAEQVIDIVHRCPSGALTAVRPDGTVIEPAAPPANEIVVSPNGPLYMSGTVAVERPDGSTATETRVALCRCGKSKLKPYCDGSHTAAEFKDSGAVAASPDADAPAVDGPVNVKLADDGPLLLDGPVTLRAASGRVAAHPSKCALCRCGHSGNKPYCDGSHKAQGWTAE